MTEYFPQPFGNGRLAHEVNFYFIRREVDPFTEAGVGLAIAVNRPHFYTSRTNPILIPARTVFRTNLQSWRPRKNTHSSLPPKGK